MLYASLTSRQFRLAASSRPSREVIIGMNAATGGRPVQFVSIAKNSGSRAAMVHLSFKRNRDRYPRA